MNTYANIFGGHNINPADLSYKFYDLGVEDFHLLWPFEALQGSRVVADKIDVTAADGIRSLWMPDATLVSVGEDVLFNNVGSFPVTIRGLDGSTLLTVAPGKQWYLYLIDNTTPTGLWRSTQFGAGTSTANAAALAGFGLRANASRLDQNILTHIGGDDLTLTANSRAQVFRHTGGAATHTFSPAVSLGPVPLNSNGWFVIEINAGTGNLTLAPSGGELIDGAATKVLGPGESCVVYCFGTGFSTMGYGRALSSTVSATGINIAGSGEIVLTAPQIAAQVQDYTGLLTGDRTITYGPGAGYWFVWNNTTGGFDTTFRVDGTDPGVIVPQTNFSILRSNGANMEIAFTANAGTVTSIATVPGETTGGAPTPITSSGTIGLANTAVTPGTYGSASEVPVVQFDPKGRAIAASDTPIAISVNQVTDLGAALLLLIPTGLCVPFATLTTQPAPDPIIWLPCNGQLVNKLTYARLYLAIGNSYGVGTATEFRVPDLDGRVIAGLDNGKNRLTSPTVITPNVPGGAGGLQSPPLTINVPTRAVTGVAGTFTGTAATLNVLGDTGDASSSQQGQGGGGFTAAAQHHSHPIDIDVDYTPAGTWAQTGSGTAAGATINTTNNAVQPTMVMRYFIKT